jgi:hypothetical protein
MSQLPLPESHINQFRFGFAALGTTFTAQEALGIRNSGALNHIASRKEWFAFLLTDCRNVASESGAMAIQCLAVKELGRRREMTHWCSSIIMVSGPDIEGMPQTAQSYGFNHDQRVAMGEHAIKSSDLSVFAEDSDADLLLLGDLWSSYRHGQMPKLPTDCSRGLQVPDSVNQLFSPMIRS